MTALSKIHFKDEESKKKKKKKKKNMIPGSA